LVVGVIVALRFDYGAGGDVIQFETNTQWIPQIDANYHIGLDGVSLPLFLLSLLVSFLCLVYTWWHVPEPGKIKAFVALVLLLETGMTGTFVALDLVLFFIFFEVVLVPMYFMIGIWGGPRREYAAVKFFLFTLFGSIFMLLGFLALWINTGTFDMIELRETGVDASAVFQNIVFLGLFLGFAIKVPMWPFHTWLPDAHTEAPTVGSVLLAAILLKMGTYGFVRIAFPILPDAAVTYAPIIGILAVIAIIYGSLCCFAQTDLKRLIAFSSVGHMGFVMLGLATLTDAGINGAIFGMVAHGLITGMLFFVAGSLHERYHTREISALGGVLQQIPRFGSVFTYAAIASLGLPGLAGFWGEMLALLGSYQPGAGLSEELFRVLMVGGGIGTVLTAGYLLWTIQRVNLGRVPERFADGHGIFDVRPLEWYAWAPLLILILVAGLYPKLILAVTDGAVQTLVGAFS
jgi:NADH-quinone oxidoreductase subunit M